MHRCELCMRVEPGPGAWGAARLQAVLTPADVALAVARELAPRVTTVWGFLSVATRPACRWEPQGEVGLVWARPPDVRIHPHTQSSSTGMHTYTLTLIRRHMCTHTYPCTLRCWYTHTHSHLCTPQSHAWTHPLTSILMGPFTLTCMHTHTHTQLPGATRALHGGPQCPGQAAWAQVTSPPPALPRPRAKFYLTAP